MEGLWQCRPAAGGTFSDPSPWDISGTRLQRGLSLTSRVLRLIPISDAGMGRAAPPSLESRCTGLLWGSQVRTSLASNA